MSEHNGNANGNFLGLAGFWKQAIGAGLACVMAMLLVYVVVAVVRVVPESQERFHQVLTDERQMFREELRTERDTFKVEMKFLREQLDKERAWENERNSLLTKYIEYNQRAIEQNQKTLELLVRHLAGKNGPGGN